MYPGSSRYVTLPDTVGLEPTPVNLEGCCCTCSQQLCRHPVSSNGGICRRYLHERLCVHVPRLACLRFRALGSDGWPGCSNICIHPEIHPVNHSVFPFSLRIHSFTVVHVCMPAVMHSSMMYASTCSFSFNHSLTPLALTCVHADGITSGCRTFHTGMLQSPYKKK